MATSFTRMDESTQEQWLHIGAQHAANSGRVADRMLMLLESLGEITDGFNADQLTHCLQTATLAERAGADEEVVFASLMHDVGKAITVSNHGAISAEMIKPYVRDDGEAGPDLSTRSGVRIASTVYEDGRGDVKQDDWVEDSIILLPDYCSWTCTSLFSTSALTLVLNP
jgi:hypothetical protein